MASSTISRAAWIRGADIVLFPHDTGVIADIGNGGDHLCQPEQIRFPSSPPRKPSDLSASSTVTKSMVWDAMSFSHITRYTA